MSAAMYVVAVKAAQLAVVHRALDKVIALHAVLVRRKVRKLKEIRRPRPQLLKLPEIREPIACRIAYRPVIVMPILRGQAFIVDGTALAVALNAGVIAAHIVQPRRIHNIRARGLRHMSAPGPMTLLAAHIPLSHLLGSDVVVHAVAAVAERTG